LLGNFGRSEDSFEATSNDFRAGVTGAWVAHVASDNAYETDCLADGEFVANAVFVGSTQDDCGVDFVPRQLNDKRQVRFGARQMF
jgi:hypothetical protein